MEHFDVIIIGAGPAGTSCAALLNHSDHKVLIVEKTKFPRFTIGESLLPQNMDLYKDAGLLSIFENNEFQYKDGASFLKGDLTQEINFKDKSTEGPWNTFQVKRDQFDKIITDEIQSKGVEILFEHSVESIEFNTQNPVQLTIREEVNSTEKIISSKFLVDASGLGKVVPKLLKIKTDYTKQNRRSYFTHIQTSKPTEFDNNKILITVDEHNSKNWFWTIPLGDNKYSLGLITSDDELRLDNEDILLNYVNRNTTLRDSLGDFEVLLETKKVQSFTSKTEKIFGENFLLIGNSGEFLDPIFSSGITIALKTACLAAPLIVNKLNNEEVNWKEEYIKPLDVGLNTFQAFVDAWYAEVLQDIIFTKKIDKNIKSHIISILAGYAWDEKNPYTKRSASRLKALSEVINLKS